METKTESLASIFGDSDCEDYVPSDIEQDCEDDELSEASSEDEEEIPIEEVKSEEPSVCAKTEAEKEPEKEPATEETGTESLPQPEKEEMLKNMLSNPFAAVMNIEPLPMPSEVKTETTVSVMATRDERRKKAFETKRRKRAEKEAEEEMEDEIDNNISATSNIKYMVQRYSFLTAPKDLEAKTPTELSKIQRAMLNKIDLIRDVEDSIKKKRFLLALIWGATEAIAVYYLGSFASGYAEQQMNAFDSYHDMFLRVTMEEVRRTRREDRLSQKSLLSQIAYASICNLIILIAFKAVSYVLGESSGAMISQWISELIGGGKPPPPITNGAPKQIEPSQNQSAKPAQPVPQAAFSPASHAMPQAQAPGANLLENLMRNVNVGNVVSGILGALTNNGAPR